MRYRAWLLLCIGNILFVMGQDSDKEKTTNDTNSPGISLATSSTTTKSTTANDTNSETEEDIPAKPSAKTYHMNKDRLMDWLIMGCWDNCDRMSGSTQDYPDPVEYPGFDGWYNNIGQPEMGAVDTPLLRRWPAAYSDGVYQPAGSDRPNPFEISDKLLHGDIETQSTTGRNALLVFFGQQVVEEILDAQRPACPPEYFNVKIPKDHRYRNLTNHTEMPFLRTRYESRTGFSPNNPRQQLNEITPYLDGGLVYGTTKTWADALRMYSNGTIAKDGLLATSHDGQFPAYNTMKLPMANPPPPTGHSTYTGRHYTEKVDRFFKLGNPRGNENPFLLTFGIVWFRWHNHLARYLRKRNFGWSDEEVFNEARKWVIATQQVVVTKYWLKEWLGDDLDPYTGYDPSVNPQIDQFFQSAALRFGHTLVPAAVFMRDYGRNNCSVSNMTWTSPVRTCNSYWKPQETMERKVNESHTVGIERLLMGMAVQRCGKEDHKIVEDLRGNVFGPLEFSRRDLMVLNIQRGRDHGLPDFNTARKAYNLKPIKDFDHFQNVDPTIRRKFSKLYSGSVHNIDVWVGGIMETDDGPGELFRAVIKDQFQRIRDGDRFWYRNINNGLFTEKEAERLENLTFYDILISVTDMDPRDIPKNPFKLPLADEDVHPNCNDTVRPGICTMKKTDQTCYYVHQQDLLKGIEDCTDPGTYDYFKSSEAPFILTFVGLLTIVIGLFTLLLVMVYIRQKQHVHKIKELTTEVCEAMDSDMPSFLADEWVDKKSPNRPVTVAMDVNKKQLKVTNQLGHLIRAVDMSNSSKLTVFVTTDNHYVMINVCHNYDLVLKFESDERREQFLDALERFIEAAVIERARVNNITTKAILEQAETRSHRQEKVEKFFRVVFAQVFDIPHLRDQKLQIDAKIAISVIYTELTVSEFAEALSMRADSAFVKKIFNLVDKDNNGFISFREFLDMLVVFRKGSGEQKLKMLFDMYDIDGNGQIKREDITNMVKSFTETADLNLDLDLEDERLQLVVHAMMERVGLADKKMINLQDFQRIFGEYNDELSSADHEITVSPNEKDKKLYASTSASRLSIFMEARKVAETLYESPNDLKTRIVGKPNDEPQPTNNAKENMYNEERITEKHEKPIDRYWGPLMKYIAKEQLVIFWWSSYTMVLLAIFAERAYYYSIEREHSGLRRVTGYGVAVTRGSASALMFTYSTLLVTMSRNTITALRETVLQFYIPFDSMIELHKYVASWALAFTVLHVIGHAVNFYHISTQTSDDLTCLFPNYFHRTHEIPKFQYWCWQTMTGLTGILLSIVTALISLFSLRLVRSRLYKWFWFIHSLYPVFYILLILHGTGRLIQEPFSYYFLLGPAVLFTIDRVITASRKTVEIPILKADILPSGVTCLTFPKPSNFRYKSGQWVRIACPALSTNDFHPFTLSSAPEEKNLTVHIRAVGPWTTNIRNMLDPTLKTEEALPTIHIDGPYGESHQDWYKYDLTIMVGGGIGVTPYASILKDIVFKANKNLNLGCKKVYFIWVTRTQKHFEWMVDILRDLEKADVNNAVSAHIFITQFYHKFDLRTILLYICERHFQRVSNKSLFTGLTAVTHFGRPNFHQFFDAIQQMHRNTAKVGVFSSGGATITQAVDAACQKLNKQGNETLFQHHYKTI